jgi:hypothetical protein
VPTRIDLQRYKKTYPFLRREPRKYFLTESDLANVNIDAATVSFGGSDQVTYVFPVGKFTSAPKVTVTPITINPLINYADFNVFIVSVNSTHVVLAASVPNSESVHIHAIEVLS